MFNWFKIELNKHEKDYDEWINNYSSLLAELKLERQGIARLLEERDDINKHIVKGKEKVIALIKKKSCNKDWQLIKRKKTIWLFESKY